MIANDFVIFIIYWNLIISVLVNFLCDCDTAICRLAIYDILNYSFCLYFYFRSNWFFYIDIYCFIYIFASRIFFKFTMPFSFGRIANKPSSVTDYAEWHIIANGFSDFSVIQ